MRDRWKVALLAAATIAPEVAEAANQQVWVGVELLGRIQKERPIGVSVVGSYSSAANGRGDLTWEQHIVAALHRLKSLSVAKDSPSNNRRVSNATITRLASRASKSSGSVTSRRFESRAK